MGTQEFYANVDLKGNELKNVVVDVVTELPATATAGRIVSKAGDFYVGNGTSWIKMADDDVVQTLKKTVGDTTDGLVKDVKDLQDAIGSGSGTDTLSGRVTTLEATVGKTDSDGLRATVAGHTTSINTNANNIKEVKETADAADTLSKTNKTSIESLADRMKTAENDIDILESAVGKAASEGVEATGLQKKVADNATAIAAVKTTAEAAAVKTDVENALNKKVDKVDGKQLSTEDFTTDFKTKLGGIETGAQVNVLEKVLFKGNGDTSASALAITDKGVTIDVSDYAKKSDITTLFKFKGTVASAADLANIANPTEGDVYNVTAAFADGSKVYPAGTNVVYVNEKVGDSYQSKWDALGGQVDLSAYAKSDDVTTAITNATKDLATTASMNTELAKKADKLSVSAGTYAKVTVNSQGLVSSGSAQITGNDISGNISASKIDGVLATDNIPDLDAAKITSGTLGADRIPGLSASKITSDKISYERLPLYVCKVSQNLTAGDNAITLGNGITEPIMAQVLDSSGNIIFCGTTISATSVTVNVSQAITGATIRIIGLR